VLEGLKAAEEALCNLQQNASGTIKLSAPITFGEQKIQPLLNDFIKLHTRIDIISELSNQRIDLVAGGFDLAIRLGHLEDSNLLAKKLAIRSTYVCASPDYIEKFGVPYSTSELSAHNCLLGTRDLWHFNEQGKEKNVRVKGNIRCNSGIGLVDAAIKGIGLIQLANDYVDDYIKSGQLIRVLD
ncbi:LysR family transcriptional regulator, partial [Psychromonas sp. PRT-SC03]